MATARSRPRQPPPSTPPEYPEHLGFILAEEDALKAMLEARIQLPKSTGVEEKVRVWYRYPDAAHVTTYPFVTLDLIGVEPALDLHTSEYDVFADNEQQENHGQPTRKLLYDPSTSPDIDTTGWPGLKLRRRHYLTYRLFYQIGLWCNNAVHDRLLTARMLRDVILPRPSWLLVPADGVWRRMEVIEWTAADLATQEGASKRIFRKMLTLSIQTDIPQDHVEELELQPYIQKLLLRVQETTSGTWMTGSDQPPTETMIPPTQWWEQAAP